MTERSPTPNITVTIGHHTRIYFAFVTTAPAELDSPATARSTRRRLRTWPASPLNHSQSMALAAGHRRDWSSSMRWSSPGNAHAAAEPHLLLPADPVLLGLNTLQHWLWQRLQAPTTNQVAA